MNNKITPLLIVMLTHNDYTVENAEEVFEQCKDSKALYWGMKEKPLCKERMKALFSRMKESGKVTALEVVGYTEEEGLNGVILAAECGADILMGTSYFKSVADLCHKHNIKYFPFIGKIKGRPSVLKGSVDDIFQEAENVINNGADGIDLLAYRFTGDPELLIRKIVENVKAPVCIAGSIDSFERLDFLSNVAPWSFTIGSAFFENKFNGNIAQQIDKVCEYLKK